MRYLSLFSGIEACTVAWHALGWHPVAFAEVDAFPSAVLAHHYPHVPNLGDVTKITDEQIAALGPIDVVVGGSPCQDLSVAGKRAGLAGARSSLFHHQARIFDAARAHCGARWLLWENVPGAFSTHGGRDFAVVVGALAGCDVDAPADGWQSEGVVLGPKGLVEWAVLDAQWFGVAQRRRRVFVVLDAGNWSDRPPVLLEPDSLRGHSAPRREAGEGIAGSVTQRIDRGGVNSEGGDNHLIPMTTHSLRADGFDASEDGTGRGTPLVPAVAMCLNAGAMGRIDGESETFVPVAFGWQNSAAQGASASEQHTPTLDKSKVPAVAFAIQGAAGRDNPASGPDGVGVRGDDCAYTLEARAEVQAVAFSCKDHGADAGDVAPTLRSMNEGGGNANGGGQVAVAFADVADPVAANQARTYTREGSGNFRLSNVAHTAMQVRRLTPRECERLQGFPDDYTLVTHRGKPAADGPRYKALGNSMAVPCMAWIGRAIMAAHGAEDAAREMEGDAR